MKRRNFFKNFGMVAAAAIVIPKTTLTRFIDSEEQEQEFRPFKEVLMDNVFAQEPMISNEGSLYVRLYGCDTTIREEEIEASTYREANYDGYVMGGVEMPRNLKYWKVDGNIVTNEIDVAFPECTGGSDTITAFAITDHKSRVLFCGDLDTYLHIDSGTTPQFLAHALKVTET